MKNMIRCLIFASLSLACCCDLQHAALAKENKENNEAPFLINNLGHEITVAFPHLGMSYVVQESEKIFRNEWLTKAYVRAEGSYIDKIFTSPIAPAISITLSKNHPYAYIIFIGTLKMSEYTLEGIWIFKVSNIQFDDNCYLCNVYHCQRITNIFEENTSFLCAEWQEKKSHKGKTIQREEVDIKDIRNTIERRRSLSSPTTTSPVSTSKSKFDISQSAFF